MAKRLIKSVLKFGWGLTTPVRRPFARRLDARIQRVVSLAVQAEAIGPLRESNETIRRIEHRIEHLATHHHHFSTEIDLVLNSLLREITRTQHQIEVLSHLVEETASRRGRLHLVGDVDHESKVG